MSDKRRILSSRLILCTVILISVSVAIFNGLRRNIYHVDEVWSYGLSNSTEGKYLYDWWHNGDIPQEHVLSPSDFFDHWKDGDVFKKYVTVQKGEEFRYDIPYHYQTSDVSPPLYYLMMHTICSFFPERFSIWYGLIPNIIFLTLCIPVLYCIGVEIFNNERQAIFAVAFWAFSRAAFSDVNYVRMYMLETLIVLVSFWLHLKIIEAKNVRTYLIIMFFVNVCGFLTHNYVYIITFFMASIVCAILLKQRNFKKTIILGITELLSVCTSFLIFPASITQMTRSEYATHTANNAIELFFSANYLKFLNVIINNITGFKIDFIHKLPLTILLTIIGIGTFYWILRRLKTKNTDGDCQKFLFLILTSFLSGYVIACINPGLMAVFEDRYFFAILPLGFMSIMYVLISMIEYAISTYHWKKNKLILINICLIVVAIIGNFIGENYFLFYQKGQRDMRDMMSKQICIVLNLFYDHIPHLHSAWFIDANKVYFTIEAGDKFYKAINSTDHCYLMMNRFYADKTKTLDKIGTTYNINFIGLYYLNEVYYYIFYLEKKHLSTSSKDFPT